MKKNTTFQTQSKRPQSSILQFSFAKSRAVTLARIVKIPCFVLIANVLPGTDFTSPCELSSDAESTSTSLNNVEEVFCESPRRDKCVGMSINLLYNENIDSVEFSNMYSRASSSPWVSSIGKGNVNSPVYIAPCHEDTRSGVVGPKDFRSRTILQVMWSAPCSGSLHPPGLLSGTHCYEAGCGDKAG